MNIFTEYSEKDEQKYFDLVVEQTKFNMDKLYKNADKAFRDTHIKTHACVQGTLEMFDFNEAEIKQKLNQTTSLTEAILNQINFKQGLLATQKKYPVWLRFANGRTQRKGDYEPDTRSMSVKVMGVEYPAVIKYAFTPVSPQPPHTRISIPSRSESSLEKGKNKGIEDHYYREELIQALAKPDAEYCWDFEIQVQTKPEMSIDDVTIVWNEDESPFLTVGRLTVKHQQINLDKQCDFCENLRFSPWNGLAVHRPVGALNRLRSIVYSIVGEYRHQKQGLNYQEPTGTEKFN